MAVASDWGRYVERDMLLMMVRGKDGKRVMLYMNALYVHYYGQICYLLGCGSKWSNEADTGLSIKCCWVPGSILLRMRWETGGRLRWREGSEDGAMVELDVL